MNLLLGAVGAVVVAAWALDVFVLGAASGGTLPWIARQEALHLSGLLSIAWMSLAMALSTRPVWLERPLGGMDRVYRTHKWAGILGAVFALVHWLTEEVAGDLLKALVGREGRVPKDEVTGLLDVMRDVSKDLGEWAFYLVLAMVAITLWKRFPYRPWRVLHQAMPVLYLMLVVHAVFLAPLDYWTQPVGLMVALFGTAGSVGALLSLAGRIGRRRRVQGRITAIERTASDVWTVACALDERWRGHRPGQFAFITFERREGAHPFTIASADQGDRTLRFTIKALGDYTRGLGDRLVIGQQVTVEGPYGRFDLGRRNAKARQVWVAGGIGITPFLAWLDHLRGTPGAVQADLHYCTRDRTLDPIVARLEQQCAAVPGITLHVHGAAQGQVLRAADLAPADGRSRGRAEVWFCGPQGLAQTLREQLRAHGRRDVRFHQEAFEMR